MAGVRTEDERDVGPSWRIWRRRQDRPRGDEVRRESGMRSAAGESSTAPWPPPTPIGGCAAPCRGSWPSRCRALANPAVGTRAPRHGQALFLFPLPRLSARGGRKGRVSLRSIKTAQLQSNGRERYRGWTVFHLPSTPEHGLAAAIDGDHAAPTSTAPPRAFAASAQDMEVLGAAELMPAAGRPGVAHARRRGRRGTTVAVLVLLETWTRSRLARRGCR